jgi:type IV pilus assembly protein PilY1
MIRRVSFLALIWAIMVATDLNAEDIDLFKGGGAQDPSPPNVLLIIDNTSNWSANNQAWKKNEVKTKCNNDPICEGYVEQIFTSASLSQGQVEAAAMRLVLNELYCNNSNPAKVNIGLMLINTSAYTSNTGNISTSGGSDSWSGYVRRAVLPMSASRCSALITDLNSMISNLKPWEVASSANYGGVLFEAFKYYGGYTKPGNISAGSPPSITAGSPIGHVGFGPKRFGCSHEFQESSAFSDACSATPTTSCPVSPSCSSTYQAPSMTSAQNACSGKNYVLFVGNGFPNADGTGNLSNLGISSAAICCGSMTGGARLGDVWTRMLSTTDVNGGVSGQQTVKTSTLNVFNAQPDTNQGILLKSMAIQGGGSYYEVNGNLGTLVDSFRNFFVSINAANEAFAPSTLAPSAGSGGLDINQVYLGMFRPDKNPRWFGNLKLYQFALDGTNTDGTPNIYLADSQATPANIRSGTGFITDNAISFWTAPSSFWNFRCGTGSSTGDNTLCGTPISGSDSPDGAVVEKGAAAQKLRLGFTSDSSNSARKVYTDNGSTRIEFNTSNVTTTQVGVTTSAERDLLVNWVRGVDNIGENPAVASGARPSMIGDVLHSEPVAVNYGTNAGGCSTTSTGDVIVYYASNDGMLHAVSGGKTEGTELWSYIPSDFLGSLKRLRDNAPAVTFPGPVPTTAFNKPYLIDGNLSVYAPDADGNCKPDKVWLFMTLRRGGRHIFALDVTDKSNPKLLWKRSSSDTGFSELGQTWSKLTPMLSPPSLPANPELAANAAKVALIFGAGYDPAIEDRAFDVNLGTYSPSAPSTSTRSIGKGVFVLSLNTNGQIGGTKFFNGGTYSFPSDVAVVSDVNTGYAERAYVGDTGGNLWRISFKDSATSSITADSSKWSMTQIAALGTNQKFLYPPDVARCEGQDVLLIGSGNREEPFDKVVPYRFYQIQDPASGVVNLSDLTNVSTLGTPPDANRKGWYFNLATGEKTVGRALTQSGTTYFPTNEAASNSGAECSTSLGTARLYGVSCSTGGPSVYAPDPSGQSTSRYEAIAGGGFPPSPTSTVVKLTDAKTGETKTLEAVLSGSHVAGGRFASTKRKFTYWYREGLD